MDGDQKATSPASSGSQDSSYAGGGRVVGHDSPAGEDAALDVREGQGDDLADRVGGDGGAFIGSGARSGDASAGRSEDTSESGPAAGYTPDAGSPGGMGGKSAGGVSPIEDENTGG